MSFSSSFSVQPVAIASSRPMQIRVVTRHNFRVEFSAINYLINATRYNKVSFDTEYPGQLFHSDPKQSLHPAAAYSLMKANVDDLKLIQVGLVVSDAEGNLPHFNTNFVYVWEFILSDFDVDNDEGDNDSIGILMRQGVDFEFNLREGINRRDFVTMLMWSGLVGRGNSRVTWITFNGAYDLGYMIKILTNTYLPQNLESFMALVTGYFGNNVFDVKHMTTRLCQSITGGLDRIASKLGVARVDGPRRRTVSNAWVTLQLFNRIKTKRGQNGYAVYTLLAGQIHTLSN
ncbi:unnamed protein product [Rhodiola kirilowii]